MADKDPTDSVTQESKTEEEAAPAGDEKPAAPVFNMEDDDKNKAERKEPASSSSEETQSLLTTPKTPAEKVRFILSDENDELPEATEFLDARTLFCQMDVLCHFADGRRGWKEKARWLKYEEKVEGGDRWSKPHVGTSSLHSLYEVRKGFENRSTIVSLDMPSTHGCMHQVAELLSKALEKDDRFPADKASQVVDVLLSPHKHLHRPGMKGKTQSTASFASTANKTVDINDNKQKKKKLQKKDDLDESGFNVYRYPGGVTPDDLAPHKSNKKMMRKIPPGAEAANILVGQVDFLDEPLTLFVRLARPAVLSDLTEVDVPTRFLYIVLGPEHHSSLWEFEEMGRAMANMLTDKVFREVAYRAISSGDILDGIDEFIDDLTVLPPSVWDPSMRLDPPNETISTDKIRRRLDPSRYEAEAVKMEEHGADPTLTRTGRICGGLIDDMKRRYSMYPSDIKDGFSVQSIASIVFLFFACITPIVTFGGLMGKSTDGYMGTVESLLSGAICGITFALFAGQPLTIVGATGPLLVFESILYQFCDDRGMDFLSFRFWIGVWITLTLVIIVVFDLSALVRYITRFTEESFAVLISLIFIVEAILKVIHVWDESPVNTGTIRGDPERHACHCQHPEEWLWGNDTDPNATLPFIPYPPGGPTNVSNYQIKDHPIFRSYNWSKLLEEDCISVGRRVEVTDGCITAATCQDYGWTLMGDACPDDEGHGGQPIPDVFLLSVLLFLGTFIIAMMLRYFRNTKYFPNIVRGTVADFAVLIAILINTGVDYSFGIDTPKLLVPSEFKTTRDDRTWIVNPMGLLPMWYLIPLSILPSLLATILIFLDQQITAVIINRKEHKLKKGPGFHLDLFVLAILIFVTSMMGLPWFVAATVRSVTHVRSLFVESETRAPGEKPQMLGVREQRVTALLIHILIGASVSLTSVLQNIPMPVLYGVFMYMGVTSLNGVQFIERIGLLMMPSKYQPDYIYLRHVPTKRVHIFTIVQIICMVTMWAVKSYKAISITFPLLVLALCFVRKFMDYVLTQSELYWLDHILPDEHRRKQEDAAEALDDAKDTLIDAKEV